MLALPEIAELRRRRRTVTLGLGLATVGLFAAFIIGFAYFPETLGATLIGGIPLSLWVVLVEFVGTWVLVFIYFRLSRGYLQPAADAASTAVTSAIAASERAVLSKEHSA
ncbi:DUF485 domain-containing protein [Gordonia jinghuaiqii]|uniref:DUF485 domain-containing protein n=1 Tax=Gordonia jinghuaiqii TaxID=2758710 RepID=A0A7D7M018_9ACTN|nr:DUF485 domain-containing protein [Gordonia jinghuaiqii]MCR5979365.1 DUF485 domain-containing protein [Gordonia jinghuaiqii]QMT04038.1 DUF485 domain-containing protein [Gordonia jinghuaiqii]